jgi:hypothetical protein
MSNTSLRHGWRFSDVVIEASVRAATYASSYRSTRRTHFRDLIARVGRDIRRLVQNRQSRVDVGACSAVAPHFQSALCPRRRPSWPAPSSGRGNGSFAIAILLWLCGCWLVLPHLDAPSVLPPAILFAGLIVILAESALRLVGGFVEKSMRPLAAIANESLLRLHFSQFRSLPIKNNTDAIVLPSPVVTTQGRTDCARRRRRFQFCIERLQDFRRLFLQLSEPRLATAPVPAPRGSARAARRRGRGGAARSPVCSSRRRGFRDSFSVSSDFNALRRGKFPSGPARRIRQRSCGSRPQRTVSRAPVYQMLWLRGFRDHTIPGRGFNLFNPLRRHFRARPFCRLGKKFVERLGTDLAARKKAKAPQPLIRRLAAQRDARRGFDGGRRRFWVAGLR